MLGARGGRTAQGGVRNQNGVIAALRGRQQPAPRDAVCGPMRMRDVGLHAHRQVVGAQRDGCHRCHRSTRHSCCGHGGCLSAQGLLRRTRQNVDLLLRWLGDDVCRRRLHKQVHNVARLGRNPSNCVHETEPIERVRCACRKDLARRGLPPWSENPGAGAARPPRYRSSSCKSPPKPFAPT